MAEIVLGRLFNRIRPYLKSDVQIVALPDAPTPSGPALEQAYYKGAQDIVAAVKGVL